jgi:hypothetical protein
MRTDIVILSVPTVLYRLLLARMRYITQTFE